MSRQETPHSAKVEMSIISMMLNSDEDSNVIANVLADGITADHFFISQNKVVFDKVVDSHNRNEELSLIELASFLKHERIFMHPESEANNYFTNEPNSYYLDNRLRDLKEIYSKRLAYIAANELLEANSSDKSAEERLNILSNASERLTETLLGKSGLRSGREHEKAFQSDFNANLKAGIVPGESYGIDDLDTVTGGMRPGELIIIGAPTSGGKSVLCMQIALKMMTSHISNCGKAVQGRKPKRVLIYTFEMNGTEVVSRLLSNEGCVPMSQITKPSTITKANGLKMKQALGRLQTCNYMIDDSADQSINTIWASAVRENNVEKVDLVVVDYLQLVEGGRVNGRNRAEEIAFYSRRLKQLAKKIGAPVISPTQLNDEGKVRESRAIAQDANVILMIGGKGLHVAKNRNGPRGDIFPYFLNGELQRLERGNYG